MADMDYQVMRERGIRVWLPDQNKMVLCPAGYKIVQPVYYKDPSFASVCADGNRIEMPMYMHRITGTFDKSLFELDIIQFSEGVGLVSWDADLLSYVVITQERKILFKDIKDYYIIGNYFESPYLLPVIEPPKQSSDIDIFIDYTEAGEFRYLLSCSGRSKTDRGSLGANKSPKYILVWSSIKALSNVKDGNTRTINLFTPLPDFTAFINSDKMKVLKDAGWHLENGSVPRNVEGLKRLDLEIARTGKVVAKDISLSELSAKFD